MLLTFAASFNFLGSISRTWRILSHGLSKSTDDNNQELLDEYSQYFDKLDSCIKKHDKKGVEETYSEILYLKQGTNPLIYSKEFPVENIDCMNLLLQDIISTNKINLQYLEACIKSFFNQCNAALQ